MNTPGKKAHANLTLPKRRPIVCPAEELRDLLDTANGFFVCNTNRRYYPDVEEEMHLRGYAAASEKFDYCTHMERVGQGDAVFMFAKGVGIIAVGRARGPCQTLSSIDPDDPERIFRSPDREWRIPVDWLIWVEDADACSYPEALPKSFYDVKGDKHSRLRADVRSRFVRDPQ